MAEDAQYAERMACWENSTASELDLPRELCEGAQLGAQSGSGKQAEAVRCGLLYGPVCELRQMSSLHSAYEKVLRVAVCVC